MSRIDDLIAELCPDGVEFKALGEVLRIKNGKDHKALADGDIPVYGSGGIMRYVETAAAVGPSVLIPRKGSLGNLFFVEGPFWVVDTIFRTEIDASIVDQQFVYHQLLTMGLGEMNQAGGVPSQTQSVLNLLRIPVPPLEVQREIVRILDQFTALEAELEARRRQYQHYRDSLLTFSERERVRWTTVSAICRVTRGRVMSKEYLAAHPGPYPVYSSQTATEGKFGAIASYDFDGEFITWTTDGANAGSVFYRDGRFSITNVCGLLEVVDSSTSCRFLYYALGGLTTHYVNEGMGNPKLMSNVMSAVRVPLPSLDEQERIVEVLDKFDALVNDLSVGLPAELAARRKQYEYYRDRLLTFKEAA